MKAVLWIAACLLLLANALAADNTTEEISYSIQLNYYSGKFNLEKILLIDAPPMPVSEGNEYKAQVVSFSERILYETSFNVQLMIFHAPPAAADGEVPQSKESDMILTKTAVDLILPWYPNAQSILIWKNETKSFEIDVGQYSLCNENAKCDANETLKFCPQECTCGNNICDTEENYVKCHRDCKSGQKDGVCDKKADSICDPDCSPEEDIDCKLMEIPAGNTSSKEIPPEVPPKSNGIPNKTLLLYTGTAIALIAIVIVVQFLKKRKDTNIARKSAK